MLWCVLGDAAQMRLEDVIAVQKRHFAIWFNPHLFGTNCTKASPWGRAQNLLYILHTVRGSPGK
jgi:hypothetical protein